MLVGNKADLRDTAAAEGQKCVPGYFGEKLAMVSMRIGWNWKKTQAFHFCLPLHKRLLINLHPV
jgi:hypothetical protein